MTRFENRIWNFNTQSRCFQWNSYRPKIMNAFLSIFWVEIYFYLYKCSFCTHIILCQTWKNGFHAILHRRCSINMCLILIFLYMNSKHSSFNKCKKNFTRNDFVINRLFKIQTKINALKHSKQTSMLRY